MIEIRNVKKGYSEESVIEKINLTVEDSSILGLIGYNGCGKTTLLNVCAGIFKADEGAVYIDGKDVFDNTEEKLSLFYVSDNMFFPSGATGNSASKYYARYYPETDKEVLNNICGLFGLNLKKSVKSYSKGMLRQFSLALALACKPKYLLIDESFDGLDPHKKEIIRKLLLEYVNSTTCSVIISSHNLSEIYNLCDKIAMIKSKSIFLESNIDDVSENFRKFTLRFNEEITEEKFNNINAKKLKISGKSAVLTVFGNIKEETEKINKLNPAEVESQLLTLEEIFSLESEVQEENEKIKKLFK